MKKFKSFTWIGVFATLFFGSVLAQDRLPQENKPVNCSLLPSSSQKKIVLRFDHLDQRVARVKISTLKGTALMTKTIRGQEQYAGILNMEELAAGDYLFSYAVEGVEKSSQITVGAESITVLHPYKLASNYQPIRLTFEERNVSLRADNEKQETLFVTLLDQGDNVIFSESFYDEAAYLKRLNLEQLNKGTYQLVIEKGRNRVEEKVVLQ